MRFTAATFKQRIAQGLTRGEAEPGPPEGVAPEGGAVDLSGLFLIRDDDEFLREAYRRIFLRECDIPGFLHHRELLRNHIPRAVVLRHLVVSEEARRLGLEYTGLKGLGGPAAGLGARVRAKASGAAQRLLGRVRWLHRTLVLRPFELLEHKVDYLFHELETRTDRLSAKLDTHTAELTAILEITQRRQDELAAAISEAEQRLRAELRPPVIRAGENILVTESRGFIVGVPGEEWRLAAHLAFRGPLEPGLTKLFERLVQPGMVVVDVGAHVGAYTLEAARRLGSRGKVYSFEPAPRTFALLRDNVQVNGFLESGVVQLRQLAVADRAGMARLGVYPEDSGHNTLFAVEACPASVEVETVTLDDALAGETHVDVVKIDAEGAEPLVLRGMRRILADNPQVRIATEFAPELLQRAGFEPGAIVDEIRSLGFRIEQVHGFTGELLPVARAELLEAISVNLLLTRGRPPGGGAE